MSSEYSTRALLIGIYKVESKYGKITFEPFHKLGREGEGGRGERGRGVGARKTDRLQISDLWKVKSFSDY